jgi:hypothetical protein
MAIQQEKVVRAMFMGHEIVAREGWSATQDSFVNESTLAFDGVIVARSSELSRNVRLSATLVDRDNRHAVEVVFGGMFFVRMKILVDGQKIAGSLK